MNTLHALKHISSFQPIFDATVQISSNFLSSFLSDHHNRNRQSCSIHSFTHPGLVVTLMITQFQQALVLLQLPITTPSSPLYSISPSFSPACPLDPSLCKCMPGHVTPCYDRNPPFNEVCSLSVSRLASKPYAEPLLFTVHLSLRPVETKGKVPAYNFNSTSELKKV